MLTVDSYFHPGSQVLTSWFLWSVSWSVQAPVTPPCFCFAGPRGLSISGHLWLRALEPVSLELLDTGSLGSQSALSLCPQAHRFPPDPPNPLPPFGSLFLPPPQPISQRRSYPFLSHVLVFSWEEGLTHSFTHHSLAHSLAHSLRSHSLRDGPSQEWEHAPGKCSDIRQGGRIVAPLTCLLINESGATAE